MKYFIFRIYWTNTQYIESYDLATKVRVKYGARVGNTFIDVTVYQVHTDAMMCVLTVTVAVHQCHDLLSAKV